MTTIAGKASRGMAGKRRKERPGDNVTPPARVAPAPVPPPLDVRELVDEFTSAAARLLAEHDSAPLPKEQVSMIVRQAVLTALRTRKQHHAQIIELERLVRQEASNRRLRERLPSWLARADLRKVEALDAVNKGWFVVLNPDDDGDCMRVVHPAYVDAGTGAVVQSGQVRIDDHDQYARKGWCVPIGELTAAARDATGAAEGE